MKSSFSLFTLQDFNTILLWYNTGIPPLTALHRHCVFHKLEVCDNATLSKSTGAIAPTVSAHFVSLCPISVTLTFQTLTISVFITVICDRDLWCYYCTCAQVTVNLINVCSDCSTHQPFPPLLPTIGLPNPRHNIEIESLVSHFKLKAGNDQA